VDSGHGAAILLHFALASFEKYIRMKIEANFLKSVAYKTLDIHVPLFSLLLGKLFYCKASNQMLPIGNIA